MHTKIMAHSCRQFQLERYSVDELRAMGVEELIDVIMDHCTPDAAYHSQKLIFFLTAEQEAKLQQVFATIQSPDAAVFIARAPADILAYCFSLMPLEIKQRFLEEASPQEVISLIDRAFTNDQKFSLGFRFPLQTKSTKQIGDLFFYLPKARQIELASLMNTCDLLNVVIAQVYYKPQMRTFLDILGDDTLGQIFSQHDHLFDRDKRIDYLRGCTPERRLRILLHVTSNVLVAAYLAALDLDEQWAYVRMIPLDHAAQLIDDMFKRYTRNKEKLSIIKDLLDRFDEPTRAELFAKLSSESRGEYNHFFVR